MKWANIKDKSSDNLLTEDIDKLKRWHEYGTIESLQISQLMVYLINSRKTVIWVSKGPILESEVKKAELLRSRHIQTLVFDGIEDKLKGLIGAYFKGDGQVIVQIMHKICNIISICGEFPELWENSIIAFIPKKGETTKILSVWIIAPLALS